MALIGMLILDIASLMVANKEDIGKGFFFIMIQYLNTTMV